MVTQPRVPPARRLVAAGLLGLGIVTFAPDRLQTAIANGDTRTLSMKHTHTDETIQITFKRNGRYDSAALERLNWFLRDWRRDEKTTMDPRLFDIVWEVTREVGATEPIHIVSAYRSPATNAMLRGRSRGVAQFSQHTLGKAMDFFVPGVDTHELRVAGLRLQRGGVGFYGSSSFVHLDTGNIRMWPRMTRDQLARVFPDGRTVHVPSDGRPLGGYAVALADVQRRGATVSRSSFDEARHSLSSTDVAAIDRRGSNWLARLFGLDTADDEAKDTPPVRQARPVATQVAAAPAEPVPVPQARPTQLAQAEVPVPPVRQPARTQAAAGPGTVDTFGARFTWNAGPGGIAPQNPTPAPQPVQVAQAPVAQPPVAQPPVAQPASQPAAPQPRLVWNAGPGAAVPATANAAVAAGPPTVTPRPRPAVRVAEAELPPFPPLANGGQVERPAPPTLALGYAPSQVTAAPAPVRQPATTASILRNSTAQAAPREAPREVARIDDPWLRTLIMAPSVTHSLSVAVAQPPSPAQTGGLFAKPATSVANVFTTVRTPRWHTERFAGNAVAFVPTITFEPRAN